MTDEDWLDRPSKSRRKRDMQALQALGERLVELPQAQLDRIALPDDLAEAIRLARMISARGGRKRQLQYIGRLMREVDPEPIRAALARIDGGAQEKKARLHHAERWRDRLVKEGDTALEELFDRYPSADRQHLRRLQRIAVQEAAGDGPPKYQRELFRALRTLFDPAD